MSSPPRMLIGDLLELLILSCHKLMLRLSQGVPPHVIFFAYLDPKTMRLADPTFLIPSKDFHELAAPRLRDGVWYFTMAASMAPRSRDRWHRYRVRTVDLGQRTLE